MGERREEVYTEFGWGNLRERDHLEDRSVDGRIILKYRVWMGKPEGKRPPGRPKCRWEDNIKIQSLDGET